jgi:hypothetical protein
VAALIATAVIGVNINVIRLTYKAQSGFEFLWIAGTMMALGIRV